VNKVWFKYNGIAAFTIF